MAKEYWHTKTLFIQWWKYKWSYKHEHCTECKWVKFKHKGRWLCTSCWDKERANDPNRIETRLNASRKFSEKNRIPLELQKKKWNKWWWTPEDKKAYQKSWYEKWKIAISTLKKWIVRKRKWLPYVEYKWHPLPFETLGKPFDINVTCTDEQYAKWKSDMLLFEEVKKFINK